MMGIRQAAYHRELGVNGTPACSKCGEGKAALKPVKCVMDDGHPICFRESIPWRLP